MPRSAERARSPDEVSLAAGIGLVLIGALLLFDQVDAIALSFGWFGAAVAAVCGAALLISGLRDPRTPPSAPDRSTVRPPER